MKKLVTFLFLTAVFYTMQAQQLEAFTAAGTSAVSPDGTLSWTVGEFVAETYISTATGKALTQGILQPNFIISSMVETTNTDFAVHLYPNPAVTHIILETLPTEGMAYQLYDISGNTLESNKIESDKTEISFEGLPASSYFIKISINNEVQKTYKIVKQ